MLANYAHAQRPFIEEPVLTPDILPGSLPTSAPAPTSLSVNAPCSAADTASLVATPGGNRSPMVSCACLYEGQGCPKHISNPKRANPFKGLYAEVQSRLQKYIDPTDPVRAPSSAIAPSPTPSSAGLYQGVERTFDEAFRPDAPFCNGKPICSLLPTAFTKREDSLFSELDTNHRGQSCGQFRQLNVKVRKNKPALVQFKSDLERDIGTRERSYFCGGYVASIAHHYRLLREELAANNSISLPASGSAPHACQKFADAFNVQSKRLNSDPIRRTTMNALSDELAQQKNIQDIWNCDRIFEDQPDAGNNRRISFTHLCGARASLIQAFTQLAVCKVSADANADYASQFGDADKALANLKRVSEQVNTACDGEIRRAKPKSEAELTRLSQACYQNRAPAAFRDLFGSRWSPYAQ